MSSFTPTTILIFGATGQIGQYITQALLEATPRFNNIVIFTSPQTVSAKASLLSSWKDKGASVIAGDVTNDSDVKDAYRGVDTVISCVGRNVLAHQMKLISLAEESDSVRWFFPSEYGTDIEYSAKSAHEKPHQVKLAVRKHIRENVKRLKYTYLVTGPYADMWYHMIQGAERAGGYDVAAKKAVVVDEGEGKVGLTTMKE
jgi:NAD(P)-dependent dehydrogenase (short-subunit alcohol dehydrogenase family)